MVWGGPARGRRSGQGVADTAGCRENRGAVSACPSRLGGGPLAPRPPPCRALPAQPGEGGADERVILSQDGHAGQQQRHARYDWQHQTQQPDDDQQDATDRPDTRRGSTPICRSWGSRRSHRTVDTSNEGANQTVAVFALSTPLRRTREVPMLP